MWGGFDDVQGKTEQMTDYIKKLRACIRWLQEAEESSTLQKENVQNQLLNERNEHKQTGNSILFNMKVLTFYENLALSLNLIGVHLQLFIVLGFNCNSRGFSQRQGARITDDHLGS